MIFLSHIKLGKVTRKFNVEYEIESGADRDRDNMIRFYPSKESLKLLNAGYNRLMANAFIEYNQKHFPKKK